MKVCNVCKVDRPFEDFYSNGKQSSGSKKYKPTCKYCYNKVRQDNFINRIKEVLRELYNQEFECENCGYNKNYAALCFHHLDPSQKDNILSNMKTASKERIIREISGCVVLCHNCHMEEHYPHLNKQAHDGIVNS